MEKANDSLQKNENREYDESILQRPINIGVKNVREVLKCLQIGTKEIKDIILNECNLIYECKICHNLFRSLANLISHKRVYCQKHCCESMTLFSNIEIDESTVIVLPEKPSDNSSNGEIESQEIDCGKEASMKEEEDTVTTIGTSSPKIFVPAEKESRETKLQKWEERNSSGSLEEDPEKKKDEKILYLKPIEGNTNAVFQQLHDKNGKTQQDNNPGKEEEPGKKLVVIIPKNVTNSSKSASYEDKKYGINYSRHKLLSGRSDCDIESLSCLVCNTRYTSLKTLYLHMVNLHSQRRWYYPCPFCNTSFVQLWGVTRHLIKVHKKNKDQISKLRVVIKKRAFLKCFDEDVLEMNEDGQSEDMYKGDEQSREVNQVLHKCSNCSRIFNHRSSVVNHEKFCAKNKNKPIVKTFINSHSSNESSIVTRPKRFIEKKVNKDFINSQTLNWRSANKVNTNSNPRKCSANGKKLESIINSKRLSCLKCHKKFCSLSNLKRHAAIHVGWTRYKCKYCSYRSYQKSECRTHIQKSHNITCTTSGLEKLIICLDKNGRREKINSKQVKNAENSEKSATKEPRKKQGKHNNQSINSTDKGVNSVSVKAVDGASNKKSDIEGGEKLLIPISIPISPVAGGNVRQMSTRFSSRQVDDIDNPAKFFGTLVTRSGAYKKLNLLPNRDQSSS
ncbi:zinc finger protein 800-like [Centruroides vittatus]|uniref:zinc finger protein 800-like n=1 Tax=Centruroides vittatus TaxID=120091 RepID=UPI00351009A5